MGTANEADIVSNFKARKVNQESERSIPWV